MSNNKTRIQKRENQANLEGTVILPINIRLTFKNSNSIVSKSNAIFEMAVTTTLTF